MGHALRKALGVIAVSQGRGQAAGIAIVAAEEGMPQLAASSLKAALDLDWDDPATAGHALAQVLGFLDQVDRALTTSAIRPGLEYRPTATIGFAVTSRTRCDHGRWLPSG
jgi:hypothetical protein